MNNTSMEMKSMLNGAYTHPMQGGIYYSANGSKTGSERLNNLPFWDWTPVTTQWGAGVSTCMFALAMGCKPITTSEGRLWMEPLIKDPAQVNDIRIPDIYDGYPGEKLRELTKNVADLATGDMIRCLDIQSPLGVAELMWDESFYTAFYECPDAIHVLLDKITRFIIAFVNEMQRICGNRYNPAGFPIVWAEGRGTMIADDTMSLVSPEMHLEFSVPYLNQIGDACGPIFYHSCTWREEYFNNVRQIRNVVAYNWNPGNSVDPAIITREFGGKAVLAPHLCLDMHKDNDVLKLGKNFADEFEFFRYIVESAPSNATFNFWFSNVCEKGSVMDEIYDYLHARGHTPQARMSM